MFVITQELRYFPGRRYLVAHLHPFLSERILKHSSMVCDHAKMIFIISFEKVKCKQSHLCIFYTCLGIECIIFPLGMQYRNMVVCWNDRIFTWNWQSKDLDILINRGKSGKSTYYIDWRNNKIAHISYLLIVYLFLKFVYTCINIRRNKVWLKC